MTLRSFQISVAAGGRSELLIDGQRLNGVRGYRLTDTMHDVPAIELDVVLYDVATVSGEGEVRVSPGARDTLLALGWTPPEPEGTQHVIEFREDGWTIQHPLACRRSGALFDCPVNRVAERTVDGPPPGGLGRWYVELDEAGGRLLLGDRATGGGSDG